MLLRDAASVPYRLIIEDDEGRTTEFPVPDADLIIGRRAENGLRLLQRNISRRHARLFRRAGHVHIEDLDSYNGVFMNGARIEAPTRWRETDRVRIGDYGLSLERAPTTEEASRAATVLDGPTELPPEVAALFDPEPAETPHLELPGVPLIMRVPRLIGVEGPAAGLGLVLTRERVVLGRGSDAELSIDDPGMSRRHAALEASDSGHAIVDLGSQNGVEVNGAPVGRAELRLGDRVFLGTSAFRYVPAHQQFTPTREELTTLEAAGYAIEGSNPTDLPPEKTLPLLTLEDDASTRKMEVQRVAPAAIGRADSHDLQNAREVRNERPNATSRLSAALVVGFGLALAAAIALVFWIARPDTRADEEIAQLFASGAHEEVLSYFDAHEDAFNRRGRARQLRQQAADALGTRQSRRGVAAFKEGRMHEAVDHLTRCLDISPRLASCHRNLAVVYAKLDDYDSAAVHYRQFVTLKPSDPDVPRIEAIIAEYERKRAGR